MRHLQHYAGEMMPESPTTQSYGVESVKRAARLLRCFTIEQPELGVVEISRHLNVHKSTISRLLSTLEHERLVTRNPETGRYRLGVGILELAGLVTLHADLRRTARPFLNQLAEMTQEAVNLAVREGDEVVNIEHTAPLGRRVLNIGWVGRRTPVHASSTGKILLAHAAEPEIAQLISRPLQAFTENTLTGADALLDELERIRRLGFAMGLEELEIGLNAVAALIRGRDGAVLAAVSTAGPSNRLTEERIRSEVADRVVSIAHGISIQMGYMPSSRAVDA
jgi:DNA-binding IclR family transcriptional regulator